MGTFLSMSGVIGKTKSEVISSLSNYANSVGGGLQEETLPLNNPNCCVIEDAKGNTTILYAIGYLEWDNSSEFISKELDAPVFSFHIHDGDLWMYILYVHGTIADQFNPIPDYWDDNLSDEELARWKGNAAVVHKYVPAVNPADIEKYLVRWDLDAEETVKAYPTDEYLQEDWQVIDFMGKLDLFYPLNDNGSAKAETYKLWTKQAPIAPLKAASAKPTETASPAKPWWKFW